MSRSISAAPALGPREFSRWAWRQLTSMRTALLLLLLLAVVSVPGSFIPQRGVDARAVAAYFSRHPKLAPVLDDLGLFSVFSSPWFSAVYLLLMVSLLGCIIPRLGVYARAVRSRPPAPPRNLARLPQSGEFTTDASPEQVVTAARKVLRGARIDTTDSTVSAEKGYLRELGNLVFHSSIVVVLVGVAIGTLGGYRGAIIVTQGDGFSNALSAYDEFASGALFDPDDLAPFSFSLTDFEARFQTEGEQRGAPRMFRATLDVKERPGDDPRTVEVEVNHPLMMDGASVFLVGQGYSPVFRVTDATGDVVFEDAVPFLPADATYTSAGVVKVPEAEPEQLGFDGFFLPTAFSPDPDQPSISIFPGAANPRVGMNLWVGDLGLDDGESQSVYALEKDGLEQVQVDGKPFRIDIQPGESADLPGGGTIEFVDVLNFARFQVSHTPVVWLPLAGVSIGLLGLLASLFVRPRRTWLKTRREDARTVVEVAALDRVPRDDMAGDVDELIAALRRELGDAPKEKS